MNSFCEVILNNKVNKQYNRRISQKEIVPLQI